MNPASCHDGELIARLKAGDSSALEQVLHGFGPEVLNRLQGGWKGRVCDADLEDALSRAVLRLWQSRREYDPQKSSLSNWLYLLARNALIDLFRVRQRDRLLFMDEVVLSALQQDVRYSSEVRSETEESRSAVARQLETILAAMSPRDRDIVLTWGRDRESGEWATSLAQRYEMTNNAVRVRLIRLRERIRSELQLADG